MSVLIYSLSVLEKRYNKLEISIFWVAFGHTGPGMAKQPVIKKIEQTRNQYILGWISGHTGPGMAKQPVTSHLFGISM
jgi:hypothetical protein